MCDEEMLQVCGIQAQFHDAIRRQAFGLTKLIRASVTLRAQRGRMRHHQMSSPDNDLAITPLFFPPRAGRRRPRTQKGPRIGRPDRSRGDAVCRFTQMIDRMRDHWLCGTGVGGPGRYEWRVSHAGHRSIALTVNADYLVFTCVVFSSLLV